MKVEYTLEGSERVNTTEISTGKQAYNFLLFMIEDLNDAHFHTQFGICTFKHLTDVVGNLDPLEVNMSDEETARKIGFVLGLPHV